MKLCKKLLLLSMVMLLVIAALPLTATALEPVHKVSEPYLTSQYYARLKSLTLTGDQPTDVVLVALSQLGYHEGDSDADMHGGNMSGDNDFVEYNRLYGKVDNNQGNGVSYGYYWCCAFATWCVKTAGVPTSVVKTEISCRRLIQWMNEKSNAAVYHPCTEKYTPKTGDLIFFNSKTVDDKTQSSHIGIVMCVKGDRVYTIEGNTSVQEGLEANGEYVCVKSYSLTNDYIVGYGAPAYTRDASVAIDFTKNRTGTQFITAASLNVRSGPSMDYNIIGGLKYGDLVTVSELSANGWGKIKHNGQDGWISLSYAQYIPSARYTISFDTGNSKTVIPSQPKSDGVAVTLTGETPTLAGYNFVGWSTKKGATKADYLAGDSFAIEGNTTLYAVWTEGEFKVSFYVGEVPLSSGFYPHNGAVPLPTAPTKDADNYFTYTFAGWDTNGDGKVDVKPDGRLIADNDITCRAVFENKYINYTVTFVGYDGAVLSKTSYHYGDLIKVPTVPDVIAGQYRHVFTGWDTEPAKKTTASVTYTAQYKKEEAKYTVKFVDGDGKIMTETEYRYGDLVNVPESTPTKSADATYTYTFTEWDKPLGMVTEDTIFTAKFTGTYIDYTVKFLSHDGRELQSKKYHYGDIPAPDATLDTTRESDDMYDYTFTGWDSKLTAVTGDASYTAQYDAVKRVYTVTFFDADGVVCKTFELGWGDKIEQPTAPEREGYAFAGWSPEFADGTTVNGNMQFTATYTKQAATTPTTTTATPGGQQGGSDGGISVGLIISLVAVFLLAAAFVAFIIVRRTNRK